MGGAVTALVAGLVSLAAEPANVKTDLCLNHCRLERAEDGTAEVLCSCTEKRFPAPGGALFELKKNALKRFESEVRNRMRGADPLEVIAVQTDQCVSEVAAARAAARAANDYILPAGLSQRPLCECVRNRVHFPLLRDCSLTHAGVQVCRFELSVEKSSRAGPLRDPTLHDYQACVAARLNYRRPETCEGVVCQEQPRRCAQGQELVNVADSESCCPAFECREEEK